MKGVSSARDYLVKNLVKNFLTKAGCGRKFQPTKRPTTIPDTNANPNILASMQLSV
jgi:hypothetical protein